MSNSAADDTRKPRLCHLKKWSDFNGYGFNLHAEKGKAGQFIGKVDPGSPAECAGLKQGDRIVEVNGTNIGVENHSQVVQRVKAVPNETKLLVVDNDTDNYFKDQKIVIRGDMPYVETVECPDEKGGEAIRSSSAPAGNQDEPAEQPYEIADEPPVPPKQEEEEDEDGYTAEEDDMSDDEVIDFNEIAAAEAATADEDGPSPRQCHLVMWPDFQGYGFNLHAEKGKPGQFIGKVDPGSPSEAAGLRQGDRIVEINGAYIGDDNHGQVVQKIKSDPSRTTMLVVDEEAENYYKQKGVRVNNEMSNVKDIQCPATKKEYLAAAGSSAHNDLSSAPDGPVPRLCHVKMWRDFAGYGFNLQSQPGVGSQFIGSVDEGSPARAAGLRDGDRIVEVNGHSTAHKDHGQVIQMIKSEPGQTKLLVVDTAAYEYYRERNVTVTESLPGVEVIVCPDSRGQDSAPKASPAPSPASSGDGPAPRLCHLKIWPDYAGYGFNLHAEKEKGKGQYVGKVDAGGPAEAAGLKSGDKIIEVNGRNMVLEDHRNVVSEIKADSKQVKLLVVDPEAYKYYSDRDQTISSGMSNVRTIVCPDAQGLANGTSAPVAAAVAPVEQEETKAEVNHSEVNGAVYSEVEANGISEGDEAAAAIEASIAEEEESVKKEEEAAQKKKEEEEKKKKEEEEQKKNEELDELQDYEVVERREPEKEVAAPKPVVYENTKAQEDSKRVSTGENLYEDAEKYAAEPVTPTTPSSPPVVVGGIEFAGSAKEARERLTKRSSRKHEVKKQEVSMRDKFELFQKL